MILETVNFNIENIATENVFQIMCFGELHHQYANVGHS